MIKLLRDLNSAVFKENTVFVNADSDLSLDLSLNDDNFDDHDPGTIIQIRFMAWCNI